MVRGEQTALIFLPDFLSHQPGKEQDVLLGGCPARQTVTRLGWAAKWGQNLKEEFPGTPGLARGMGLGRCFLPR